MTQSTQKKQSQSRLSHVIGFDDAPFIRAHRGDVLIVGTVYAGTRFEGVISGKVRRDGVNSTKTIAKLVSTCKFSAHLQAVLLQGIAVAGFNVIDIHKLNELLKLPVLVVIRKKPNVEAIKQALLTKVPGGNKKWKLIQKAGPVEAAGNIFVQRAGLTLTQASEVINSLAFSSQIPEPLRAAHLIAGGIITGESGHRV